MTIHYSVDSKKSSKYFVKLQMSNVTALRQGQTDYLNF